MISILFHAPGYQIINHTIFIPSINDHPIIHLSLILPLVNSNSRNILYYQIAISPHPKKYARLSILIEKQQNSNQFKSNYQFDSSFHSSNDDRYFHTDTYTSSLPIKDFHPLSWKNHSKKRP